MHLCKPTFGEEICIIAQTENLGGPGWQQKLALEPTQSLSLSDSWHFFVITFYV